jgi:L-ascorbate metabolism protein UlaG (beta-lactamase superfamily)
VTHSFFQRVVQGAYSGMQRYPRHLWGSVRDVAAGNGASPALVRPAWAASADGHASTPGAAHPGIAATWIGHATVLLRMGDVNILTDPVFSNRIGMSVAARTFGLARVAPPACRLDDLPPIDLVLISHAHFDHLDKPTLQHIASDRTVVVTAERTRRLIPGRFAEVVELPWGRTFEHRGVGVTALQAAHWGARTALDQRRGYSSYLIDSPEGRVFFAGDTAHTTLFSGVRGVDLAIFGIGAYEPWINAHANPEQVWEMFSSMQAACLLPMHHSTFELGKEPMDEPLRRLRTVARDAWGRVVGEEMGKAWSTASDRAR